MNKKISITKLFLVLFTLFLVASFVVLSCGCSPNKSKTTKKETKTEQSNNSSNSNNNNFNSNKSNNSTPTYADRRWPTFNNQLLAIPESDRWYTAASRIGTNGVIAGPVVQVYQASNSNGCPTFIDIGVSYPSSDRAQIVIWEKDMPKCYQLVKDANKSKAWVSVTGYIESYRGTPQITTNNSISWTTWSDVS